MFHRTIIVLALFVTGCTSYTTPGRPADMQVLGVSAAEVKKAAANDPSKPDFGIDETRQKRPLAHFPSAVAVARVQDSGYHSYSASSYGTGKYSVVTTRDIETPQDLERLAKLPMM